jgi:hypothetical protein
LAVLPLAAGGCGTEAIVGGVIGGTIYGAASPAQELEQIYYLGSFDPRGQLPPAMYRIRVHGQASAISGVKFASGWVPAGVIDSLTTHAGFSFPKRGEKDSPLVQLTRAEDKLDQMLSPGRRLMQFGPEGFREAPKDHRLVIVMGQSPQAFFEAIDGALGDISIKRVREDEDAAKILMLRAQLALNAQEKRLDGLMRAVAGDIDKSAKLAADTGAKPDEKKDESSAAKPPGEAPKPVASATVVTPQAETTTSAPPGGKVTVTTVAEPAAVAPQPPGPSAAPVAPVIINNPPAANPGTGTTSGANR